MGVIPIVTLDKIYIDVSNRDVYFLDCTRISGCSSVVSRKGINIDNQIKMLAYVLRNRKIILADDVVFSGCVLRNIINKFRMYGIDVVGVIASICTMESFNYFNENLLGGIKCNYILGDDVIDQICERDFYFGMAGSGILLNNLCKAPYFKPFGNPCERASIPSDFETFFSIGCLDRSINLWQEIDKLKCLKTMIYELPEMISNTNRDEEVVKTLMKARNTL